MKGQVIENGTGAIEIARKKAHLDHGYIVLAMIPTRDEYVTWWMSDDGKMTVSGHYTTSFEDAQEDFETRI